MRETTGSDSLLAALAAGAGAIHLAMVPDHMGEWPLEGMSFLAVGWLQLAFAALVLIRPNQRLRNLGAVGSAVVVVLWAISRTTGFPVGPASGVAAPVSFIDLVSTGLEVVLIVAVLSQVTLHAKSLVMATLLPVAVLGLSTAAIASPSARNHAHGDIHDEAAHGETSATLAGGHDHPDDFKPYAPMDVASFKLLGEQMQTARAVAMRYPTVGAAKAEGFVRRGMFMPGQGLHMYPARGINVGGSTPIERPAAWLYAGAEDTSPVVGLMYIGRVDFAGENERWHAHANVCLGPPEEGFPEGKTLSESEDMTEAACRAKSGMFVASAGPLMHVWPVAGWESPLGVFSHDNPLVVCTDGKKPGEVKTSTGGCKGLA